MAKTIADAETDISIFGKAKAKFNNCQHSVQFSGHNACKLFFFQMNSSMDILHYCASCKENIKDPTTTKVIVRSR